VEQSTIWLTAKYQRLVGQLMEYKWKGQTVSFNSELPQSRKNWTLFKEGGLTEDILEDKVTVYQK
jgi:hypothetical protein